MVCGSCTNPSSVWVLGTLNCASLRRLMTYCSSTRRRSCFARQVRSVQHGLQVMAPRSGCQQRTAGAYLEPVGNVGIDSIDALDSIGEDLDGLSWLEIGLCGLRKGAIGQRCATRPHTTRDSSCAWTELTRETHQHSRILGPCEIDVHCGQSSRWR